MNITAVTRFKHGALFGLMKKLKWTRAELVRRTGGKVSYYEVGGYVNLTRRPTDEKAIAIQVAFGEAGEYFDPLTAWPETFKPLKSTLTLVESRDVTPEQFVQLSEARNVPMELPELAMDLQPIHQVLSTLNGQQQAVLEYRFLEGRTLEETGECIGLSKKRTRKIEAMALRRLQRPARAKILSDAYNVDFVKPAGI